ncbi:MAG: 4Fe-4S binding protein [Chloroflexota bacterium]|nr:4Fe-4S binding protein [Chloroflexota bacterium]
MSDEAYERLRETMARRGHVGWDLSIPEFDEMVRVLFTPEEAGVSNAMPQGSCVPGAIAEAIGRSEVEVTPILEGMADKGLIMSFVKEGTRVYSALPLMPGIFELQFMRGTTTHRDYEIARAINGFRNAVAAASGGRPRVRYPMGRVIPVDRHIDARHSVRTYDQVMAYLEEADPISLGTCYCRHEARLVDPNDVCGMPMEVCIAFGRTAENVIERRIARRVSKEEAADVMRQAEEAGLVHACVNMQKLDFICNCCPCHCAILVPVLRQPKPSQAIVHTFEPSFDPGLCTLCGTCVDRCPANALAIGDADVPEWDKDRCIGCGVCASGCAEGAINLVEMTGALTPPADRRALAVEVVKSIQASA